MNWREKWAGAFTSQHGAAIKTAKDLTKRLAQLATVIRKSVNEVLEFENKNGPLTNIYDNFKQTLFHNLTHDDFADMYAQTICYGLLAARIMRKSGGLVADDAALIAPLTQPFLKDLMETFLAVGGRKSKIDFNELGIDEVVDALYHADMDAVLRDFGNRNPDEDPILHFYEYFLRDYDSIKREQRGVYYTPLPVVRFIVRSVDEILQKTYDLKDGLADTSTWAEVHDRNNNIKIPNGVSPDEPFVQILDPALGTGRFLVEVISLIEERMKGKWNIAGKSRKEIIDLWNDYVSTKLLPRLNGFELMMAPYAIAHIKIAMKLAETGYYPKDKTGPRVRVFLTNTLEKPIGHAKQTTMRFITESLAEESRGADRIKNEAPITVVIGNPPYSATSANMFDESKELVFPYRFLNGVKIKEKGALQFEKNINDDYIKFFAYAHEKVIPTSGVLGLITNNTYIDASTLRGMRSHLLKISQEIRIFDLHGDADKREYFQGGSDENVFNIKKGVAIIFLITKKDEKSMYSLYKSDLIATRIKKYKNLSDNTIYSIPYEIFTPKAEYYYFLNLNVEIHQEYQKYTSVSDIFSVTSTGFESGRDEILTDFTKELLDNKLLDFCSRDYESLSKIYSINEAWGKYLYSKRGTINKDPNYQSRFLKFLFRPFDQRWCFFRKDLLKTNSYNAGKHLILGTNLCLIVMRQVSFGGSFTHAGCSNMIPNNRMFYSTKGKVNYYPLFLYPETKVDLQYRSNISEPFCKHISKITKRMYVNEINNNQSHQKISENKLPNYLQQSDIPIVDPYLGRGDLQKDFGPRDVFDYIYSILHSPMFRKRYTDFLKSDFPRIPLPNSADIFIKLVELGRKLVALHIMDEREAHNLIQPETRYIGRADARVEKGFPKYSNGKIMVNASSHFEDVTPEVWNFEIGGYQVCEKWLKARAGQGGKNPSPGRILTEEDILHYRRITIAIRETIKLMQQIDEVINAHGGWPEAFAHS